MVQNGFWAGVLWYVFPSPSFPPPLPLSEKMVYPDLVHAGVQFRPGEQLQCQSHVVKFEGRVGIQLGSS